MNVPFGVASHTVVALVALLGASALGNEKGTAVGADHDIAACREPDTFFVDEVWAKVGERSCAKCHTAAGDAKESKFLLDPAATPEAVRHNCAAFRRVAGTTVDGRSRLLVKAGGGLDHGGGVVLAADSTESRILERFVERLGRPATPSPRSLPLSEDERDRFFDGVRMATPDRLLRRVTLSLAARLPTDAERSSVAERGLDAMDAILDDVMREEAFLVRLQEGFNDILLTQGYNGNGEEILSYEHFVKTRLWYQKHDLSHVPEEERQRARYALVREYREAIRREPLELIAHIVRNDRPFTEIVTADYIMVSPYSARGYGLFEEVRERFENPDDHLEFVPARLKALVRRNGQVQESATGFYPHAGILSTFQYLRRYPTTETNRNRLRSRMYYQHFLGIDVMALAPRVSDAAAVSEKYDVPTMQAADCVVCHKSVDPVAGLFQAFNDDGHLGPRKEGWYEDMFGPGLEGEGLEESERWRSLQWLGERTARDPRFATAMVEHVYEILMGRRVLLPPEDVDDPRFEAQRRAWRVQRSLIDDVAEQFVAAHFDLKVAFKTLVLSDLYRVDGLERPTDDVDRLAELDDVGLVRLTTPEQLERKIAAIFGEPWGRLVGRESSLEILYGGIDSQSVTERGTDPSGAMGAIQRTMSNDVACRNVALDFTRPPAERRLFPAIEPDVVPGDPTSDAHIRRAIVHLHDHVLGVTHTVDDPEVDRTFRLFAGIVADARTAKVDRIGSYSCERVDTKRLDDPDYTLRAWRGVVTYLLRQHDFLYE